MSLLVFMICNSQCSFYALLMARHDLWLAAGARLGPPHCLPRRIATLQHLRMSSHSVLPIHNLLRTADGQQHHMTGAVDVVALGAAGVDTIMRVDRSWCEEGAARSQKLLPFDVRVLGAGMASSAAAAAARLGGRTEVWSRVGEDEAGDRYLRDMEAEGVDTHNVRRLPAGNTTISTILVDPAGERLVVPYYDPGLDRDPGWLPLHRIRPELCGCVLADVRWPEGAESVLRAARAVGVPSVLDADTAARDILLLLVPLADFCIFSLPGLQIYCASAAGVGPEQQQQQQQQLKENERELQDQQDTEHWVAR
eukprot:COSAG05_NODE_6277_length_987_cov_0.864865_1_plen_309_part_01